MYKCPLCKFEHKTGGYCPCGELSGQNIKMVKIDKKKRKNGKKKKIQETLSRTKGAVK